VRSRTTKQACLLLFALVALLIPSAVGRGVYTASADQCNFRGVFKTLHDLLPDQVGECLQDAHRIDVTGDMLQQTSRGMLVFRREDGWTGFTDGATTWLVGPSGVLSRPNDARFTWESDAGAAGTVLLQSPGLSDVQAQRSLGGSIAPAAQGLVGHFTAAPVPGSAQMIAFAFQVDVDRPGNFKVEATLQVTENASIAFTDGLVTSSEQGEFAAQPYDPAEPVNGRRLVLHWPLDPAFTPMRESGRASGTVYVQCLEPGPVAANLHLRVVQAGGGDLSYDGTAVSQCGGAPLFIPTPVPSHTPRPTLTPTSTFTATETATPNRLQATATQTALEAAATARAEATFCAKQANSNTQANVNAQENSPDSRFNDVDCGT
jgi:hypothetical protein